MVKNQKAENNTKQKLADLFRNKLQYGSCEWRICKLKCHKIDTNKKINCKEAITKVTSLFFGLWNASTGYQCLIWILDMNKNKIDKFTSYKRRKS